MKGLFNKPGIVIPIKIGDEEYRAKVVATNINESMSSTTIEAVFNIEGLGRMSIYLTSGGDTFNKEAKELAVRLKKE